MRSLVRNCYMIISKQLKYFLIIGLVTVLIDYSTYRSLIFFYLPIQIFHAVDKILEVEKFKEFVHKEVAEKNIKILTGSNTYFAIRDKRKSNYISNYWVQGLKNNSDPSLFESLNTFSFKYLVIENNNSNIKTLSEFKTYNIIYKNEIGIIAKHN